MSPEELLHAGLWSSLDDYGKFIRIVDKDQYRASEAIQMAFIQACEKAASFWLEPLLELRDLAGAQASTSSVEKRPRHILWPFLSYLCPQLQAWHTLAHTRYVLAVSVI